MCVSPRIGLLSLIVLAGIACSDAVRPTDDIAPVGARVEQRLQCVGDVRASTMRCTDAAPAAGGAARDVILGNQGRFVQLTSSNIVVTGQVFAFDVALHNLLEQSIGTTDGVTADPSGIRVFFASGPTVTGGTGAMDFTNPLGGPPMYDGVATFTASNQPFYRYVDLLATGQPTAPKTWRLRFDPGVTAFSFSLLVSAPVVLENGYVTGHPHLLTLMPGETQAVGGTVVTPAGTPIPGRTIAYGTSDPSVAAVDAGGIVTAGAARGLATITLQSGTAPGFYATTVNVCPTIPTIASGATVNGTLAVTDCYGSGLYGAPTTPAIIADIHRISLTAGQHILATLTGVTGGWLALVDPTGTTASVAVGATPISWIVSKTGIYTLEPQKNAFGGPIAYSLTVTVAAPTLSITSVLHGGSPADLSAVAGEFDVSLVAPGAGTLDLFLAPSASCGSGAIDGGDVQVATLSLPNDVSNLVELTVDGAELTAGNAPRFMNGAYCLKARLTSVGGTALAPPVALTLANPGRYVAALSFTKTTALGAPSAVGSVIAATYTQGDLTVVVTPVDYSGSITVASLSLTLDGAGKTLVLTPAPGTQTFTGVFGSSASTPAASSIFQYQTTPATGDSLRVTSATSSTAQPVTFAPGVASTHIDNRSPNTVTLLNGGNGLPATNWINGAYAFSQTIQNGAAGDYLAIYPTTSLFGYRANDGGFVALPGGTAIGDAACSQTGWTMALDAAGLPNTITLLQNRLRHFEHDPLGNIRCTDLPNPFGVDNSIPILTILGPANRSTIWPGTLMTSTIADTGSGLSATAGVEYTDIRDFSSGNCVHGTVANGCAVTSTTDLVIDAGTGTPGYYHVTARAVDLAGNRSPVATRDYLVDGTAPTVSGITIPATLTGGVSQTFTSTATDNVDLKSANFDMTYSALTGLRLLFAADDYGPNWDATRVTSGSVNANVWAFMKQLQPTNASGFAVPLSGADSGEVATITVRAVDAANLVSVPSTAGIPNASISSSAGFAPGFEFNTFVVQNGTSAAESINNGAGTTKTSTILTATTSAFVTNPQSAFVPFTQVCFFYQQTAAGNVANPAIPMGAYVQIGCSSFPSTTSSGFLRTYDYALNPAFDPAAALGTTGTVSVIAIGVNQAGVGLVTQVNTNITLTD